MTQQAVRSSPHIRDERGVTDELVRLATRPVFTTGDVAKICRVSMRTVSQWIDSGKLAGYLIPGRQDRRVRRDDLLQFLRFHGMMEEAASIAGGLLYVGRPAAAAALLSGRKPDCLLDVGSYASAFLAGMHAANRGCSVVVCDFASAPDEVASVAVRIRQLPTTKHAAVAAVLAEDQGEYALPAVRFDLIVQRPFDPAVLQAFVSAAVAGEGGAS